MRWWLSRGWTAVLGTVAVAATLCLPLSYWWTLGITGPGGSSERLFVAVSYGCLAVGTTPYSPDAFLIVGPAERLSSVGGYVGVAGFGYATQWAHFVTLPLWLLIIATAPLAALRVRAHLNAARLVTDHRCRSCGYDLRGSPGDCPECGAVGRDEAEAEGWCCGALRHHFDQRHERGVFVFAERPDPPLFPRPSFWLGVRAMSVADAARLPRPADGQSLQVMLETRVPVRFCPWCGRRLARFYRRRWEQLQDEAATLRHPTGWSSTPGETKFLAGMREHLSEEGTFNL